MVEQPDDTSTAARRRRVFISYALETTDGGLSASVRELWEFLRANGVDATLDLPAVTSRKDWSLWMADQIRDADVVLVIASREYRERAEGRSGPDVGRGVQWEARLIRDAFYRDPRAVERFVPVVLPGQSLDGVPDFLAPSCTTVYHVSSFTVAGAEELLRMLTSQPGVIEPPLGRVPELAPRPLDRPRPAAASRPGAVHNELHGNLSGLVVQAGTIDSLTVGGAGGFSPPVAGPSRSRPAHEVGVGVRGWKPAFRRLCSWARERVTIGEPTTDVEPYGPGVRQEFADWVLCALPDGRMAAVAESVWDALHVAGSGAVDPAPLAAVGFPVGREREEPGILISDDATRLDLAGGAWGPGTLFRPDAFHDWEWRPRPDNFAPPTRTYSPWQREQGPMPLVRIGVTALTSIVWSDDWNITPERRRKFENALPDTDFGVLARTLSSRRSAVPDGPWTSGQYDNHGEYVSYRWRARNPDVGLVSAAEVTAYAAKDDRREITTSLDFAIYDYDHSPRKWLFPAYDWPAPEDMSALVTSAWKLVTHEMLELFAFPHHGRRWRDVPSVILQLFASAERAHGGTETAVTIPAVPNLTESSRGSLVEDLLPYLLRNFG